MQLLVNYGIKAAGGPAFLKRTREAVSQLQTRTRTGYTYSQLQTRTRTCSCTSQSGLHRNDVYAQYINSSYYAYLRQYYNCSGNLIYQDESSFCSEYNSCPSGNYLICTYQEFYINECQIQYESGYYYYPSCSSATLSCPSGYTGLYQIQCTNTTTTSCNWSSYTGWSNTSSCSASSPSCTSGAVQRQCQTVTLCAWNDYSDWSDVSSCTASAPACTNGAVQTECQTVYNWGEWSAYEEVDICEPQSPALGAGAVEIECVPQ